MTIFKEIAPEQISHNPFQLLGKDWMLISAEKEGRTNAMTASWGGMGVMWNKNVAFIVIRPQRFTKTLVDAADTFSLSFFDDSHRPMLQYMGAASGKNEDKIAKANLTVMHADTAPVFAEAKMVMLCRKMYTQPYNPNGFIDPEVNGKWYPEHDHHTLYVAEITKVLVREDHLEG